jgi:HlyD family secretion protein
VQGIVVSRNVDVGQTVAASLQAPTLFLIAQDLTRMQVDSNVSEADIGQVCEDQRATFTVDAYPNTPFTGRVVQVRNAPITVQNVVTYDAVVEVPNPELKLNPGMTANVTFVIAERADVLKVPNAALRFQPPGAEPQAVRLRQDATGAGRPGGVWILDVQGRPEPRPLTLGIADDTSTEVLSGELQTGQEVITGVLAAGTRSSSTAPGFGPPRF